MIFLLLFTFVNIQNSHYNDEEQYVPRWFKTHSHPSLPPHLYYIGVGFTPQTQNSKEDIKLAKKSAVTEVEDSIYNDIKIVLQEKVDFLSSFILNLAQQRIKEQAYYMAKEAKIDEIRLDKRHHLYYTLVHLDKSKLAIGLVKEINKMYNKAVKKANTIKNIKNNSGQDKKRAELLVKLLEEICDVWIKSCLIESIKKRLPNEDATYDEIKAFEFSEIVILLSTVTGK